jgi:hypothetical protein
MRPAHKAAVGIRWPWQAAKSLCASKDECIECVSIW